MSRHWVLWLAGLLLAAMALRLPGPIGHAAAHVALGFTPGLGLALLLLPRGARTSQITLGAALGPMLSTSGAWALLVLGRSWPETATILLGVGLLLLALGLAAARRRPEDEEQGPGMDGVGWAILALAVVLVSLPPALNAFNRIRSDSWIHAGIAAELLEHGVPPIDPRFAGMPINYIWFYDLYLGLIAATDGKRDLFGSMVLMNVTDMAILMAITWLITVRCWRSATAARGGLLLLSFGLNAGAYMLWPLQAFRALGGQERGHAVWARVLSEVHFDDTYVFQLLAAPFSAMVVHWDKWTVGSAIGYAYLFIGVILLSISRSTGPDAWRWRGVTALATASMMLFHSIVGLSVVPVTIGALVLRWLLSPTRTRDASETRHLGFDLLAIMVGAAATLPYLLSITAGWSADRSGVAHQFIRLHWVMPWTLLTACGIAGAFAIPGLRRAWIQADATLRLIAAWLVGMVGYAVVVHLPEGNELKFVWQVFFALAVLGGPSAWEWVTRRREGMRRVRFIVVTTLVFIVPTVIAIRGLILDHPEGYQPDLIEVMKPPPGSAELHAWIQSATPRDALFLDAGGRDHLMVLGRRRLLVGTLHAPQRAAFPADEMELRRRVQTGLFGPLDSPASALRDLRDIVHRIRTVHAVEAAYLVFRDADREPTRWSRVHALARGSSVAYRDRRFVVLRVPVE